MPRPGQKRTRTLAALNSVPHSASMDHDAADKVSVAVSIGADDEGEMDVREDDEDGPRTKAGQALPVAILDDDFDGEPEDGATYLALAK